MSHLVDILVPTLDNYQYVSQALVSLVNNRSSEGLYHIYVVNNGHPRSCDWVSGPHITLINHGRGNIGWEGALKEGLALSKAPYVCFFNDDAFIPPSSRLWLNQLLQHFKDSKVGAVGPSSNVVMGMQNIFGTVPYTSFSSRFLIGFCLLVRRSALEEVGGVDASLPGGDDLDLSIRLRKAGYKLIVDRDVFVYHHGFKTGERIYGTPDKTGGWNSFDMTEKTNHALIRKHGFRWWWETMQGVWQFPESNKTFQEEETDIEGKLIRERIDSTGTILDLGCGGNKTLPEAIGVDMIPTNDPIETLTGAPASQASITADVSAPLPFDDSSADTIIARHILEHMLDPITTVRQWVKVLKPGGKLVVAVPFQTQIFSIPMNIEHVHAWNPPAMKTLLESCGVKVIEQLNSRNGVSFITVAQKEVSEKA